MPKQREVRPVDDDQADHEPDGDQTTSSLQVYEGTAVVASEV